MRTVLFFTQATVGKKWTAQASGTEETLRSIRFTDQFMGWAVGGDLGVGVIVHTNNGGKKWEVQDPGDTMIRGFQMNSVFALGKQIWLAGGNGVILRLK